MESQIKIIFPYKIENRNNSFTIPSKILRKSNIVIIVIPFDLDLYIANTKLIDKRCINKCFSYSFEFLDISSPLVFLKDPKIYVVENFVPINSTVLENEMNRFMEEYEGNEKKENKEIVDDEGFITIL
ncbi:DUF5093 domain-containing protein [Hamiltosporidium magnivora]|uniref:DUF5093 domain-containing protein n=1 Tax=Hamiltosporidium magnivora TaxID=148818 RepID=A0A4Q9LMJ9_9MICR|nr:DUF5093 domain-containing protein [Hamiltosporidium magnivora]